MPPKMLQKIAVAAVSSLGSFAVVNALQPGQVQAAVLTYESELTVTSATQGSIANAAVTFLKAPSVSQPGLFDYTFQSFTASFLNNTYGLSDLLTPTNIALAQSLSTLLPTEYASQYQTVLANVVGGTLPTYTGDGDFPPTTPFSYAFSAQDVGEGVGFVTPYLSPEQLSLVSSIAALFPSGGEATFSSTLIASTSGPSAGSAEGVPEPTTMAGLALAGAGLVAARRRLNKQKAAA